MKDIVLPALDAIIATLPAQLPPAEGELGYGVDLSCVEDCDDDFRTIGPNTARIILQALARRLITPRGRLIDDSDYGLDGRGLLHKARTLSDIRTLQPQIIGEWKKDKRVERVQVAVTYDDPALRISGLVTPYDPKLAPFPFVMRLTEESNRARVEIED